MKLSFIIFLAAFLSALYDVKMVLLEKDGIMKGKGKGLRTQVRAFRSPGFLGREEGGLGEGMGFGVFDDVLIFLCYFLCIKTKKARRKEIIIKKYLA